MQNLFRPQLLWILIAAGCASSKMQSVPVTPVPLAPEKVEELKKGMVGEWKLVKEMPHGATAKEDASGTALLTFGEDGSARYQYWASFQIEGLDPGADRKFTFQLDGGNVRFSPEWMTMRVDGVTPASLDIFVYELGYHWYFERAQP
jgi:hypothetical protein